MRAVIVTLGVIIAVAFGVYGIWGVSRPAVVNAGATAKSHSETTESRDEAARRFEKIFRYSGGEAGKKAVEDAIEDTVRKMNPLIRSIARRRMREANPIIPELGFSLSGDPIITSYIDGRLVEAPADGRPVPWTDGYGEKIRVSHELVGNTLVQTMSGKKGDRRNEYRFEGDDRKAMTMTVEIRSSSLPAPLRYSVQYRRSD